MYDLIKKVTNTQGQYSCTVETSESEQSAKIRYHQMLAAYYNAIDVSYAVVLILDEYGKELQGFREIVDKRPAPEPTEE